MRDDITKKYTNGEITVVWQPSLCAHSTNCWRGLGSVFKPKERPWVQMNGATTKQIAEQVANCPSGALSYYRNSESDKSEQAAPSGEPAVVQVSPNGPLVVTGEIVIKHRDGSEEKRAAKTSLCRCGQSNNKPFCDGSHTKCGFQG